MADSSADAKHETQEPAQSWEESFTRAFNAICRRFWRNLRERRKSSAAIVQVTQPDCRVPARKPPTSLRPKQQQRAAQGLQIRDPALKSSAGQRPRQRQRASQGRHTQDPPWKLSAGQRPVRRQRAARGLHTSGVRGPRQTQGLCLMTGRVAYDHETGCTAAGCRIPEDSYYRLCGPDTYLDAMGIG
ncbi:Hypothetical predicted protein [Pelobates cultripes]|uniref:Uncharacterized protein n=1 Tax=Pelobates cultripes TaxID=61616 RepID=A0AAD1REC9_PELCU|nr:Hypothetical predicted protein [Pelobates cultripes]